MLSTSSETRCRPRPSGASPNACARTSAIPSLPNPRPRCPGRSARRRLALESCGSISLSTISPRYSSVPRGGTDEYLGEIVLNEIDPHDSNANLRLALRPGQRGRGFGSEGIALVLAHAFGEAPDGLGLHRVSLDVLSINPRARMLYESLGFVVEGRLRESHRDGDFWCDAIVMA